MYFGYLFRVLRGGRNRIGRREKWPKKSWEEGEIGEKVGRREKKTSKRLGRREKLAQKVRRREKLAQKVGEGIFTPLFHPLFYQWVNFLVNSHKRVL